jgi:hypothetical protein
MTELTANGNPKGTITELQTRRIYALIKETSEEAESWNQKTVEKYGKRISGLSKEEAKDFIQALEEIICPMTEPTTKAKDDSVGALWSKSTPTVGEYLTGNVMIDGKKVEIVCFLNKYKTEDKHPKYRVFLSKPREMTYGNAPQSHNQEKPSGALPGIPAGARPKSDTDDISIEEIPF